MGVEQLRDGTIIMLVLDPSHSPAQMAQFNNTSTASTAMRLVRISTAAMKARQYQVVAVIGTMDTEIQYQVTVLNILSIAIFFRFVLLICGFFPFLQQSKVLNSMRIPQDR